MTRPVGRPRDEVRDEWVKKFDIKRKNNQRDIPERLLIQLEGCASDVERRLILGVSEQFTPEETAEHH